MKRRAMIAAGLAACLPAPLLRAEPAKLPPWEKFDEEDGISVYRRDVPGSDVVALRGEAVVAAPILRVASVLTDVSRATEWIDSLEEAKIVRKISDTEYIKWDHIGTPFVLADRDFVFNVKLELKAKEKQMIVRLKSVQDAAAPKTDFVRGHMIYGMYVMTSIDGGKKTKLLTEMLCDPKGSVAKWMVNLFQKSWPHKTITALRAQVKKPDIKDNPKLKDALTKEGII
ncbi:MAG TPA: START domain-containing protein [Polyangiaceae bacterium]|nr:START domain-containing protein [Polyangiaceae bacterium]